MGNAQIIAVDLADDVDVTALFPGDAAIAVHPVDDVEEAADLAHVVGAAIIVASVEAAGTDPLARFGSLDCAEGGAAPLLAIVPKEAGARPRVYAKPPAATDWIVMGPAREILGPVLAAILAKGVSIIHVELPDNAALRHRLADIGFTGLVKTAAGDTSIQTELQMVGRKAIVRSTAFRSGRIALSRRFPLGFAASPVDEARWLAEELHRETCALVVAGEP